MSPRDKPFGSEDVRVDAVDALYRGFFDYDRLRLSHRRFAGGWSGPHERLLLRVPNAVAVLPYDPSCDTVVLIEQFRQGALDHPEGPWLLEAVAGLKEDGESDAAAARREVEEETGLAFKALVEAGVYLPSPGSTTERTACFCAWIEAPLSGGVHGLASEGEDIKTHVVAASEAFALVDEGLIAAANAVVPLRWLQLNRERLRQVWVD